MSAVTKATFSRFLITAILVVLTFGGGVARGVYADLFRLSSQQVSADIFLTKSACAQIRACHLQPGDILIRRYITERTWWMDRFFNLYFTHAAVYLGAGRLAEALGIEKNPQADVQITAFSKSDWFYNDVTDWIIVRPRYQPAQLAAVQKSLEAVAADPAYRFGLPKWGAKQTTCADLVWRELQKVALLPGGAPPALVTPDYLFAQLARDPAHFQIFAYNFSK